jgi:hypothetical protein
MKAQCVHSDTGLCETCFKYESRIAELPTEDELEDILAECGVPIVGIKKVAQALYDRITGGRKGEKCH